MITSVGRMRLVAFLLLGIASFLPLKTCQEQYKSRQADGSLIFETESVSHDLWEEASSGTFKEDVFFIGLVYFWPIFFLGYRFWQKRNQTKRLLGVIESLAALFFLGLVALEATLDCWSIFGIFPSSLETGAYLAFGGNVLYLAAWPTEALFRRKAG